jgi:hypothetical protein
MSELKVNKISPRSGTDITLGDSADTITIPSGATFDASNATVTYPAGSITDAAISSTAAIQQSKISGSPGFRNIVINGDMQIAQRSTSVASITVDGYYTCDRWNVGIDSFGTWTQSQSSDVPSGYGFATSLKMDCTTAQASPASSSVILLEQKFEGQNLQYLKYGTANAEQVTLSFWHKHTKTGTNIVELLDADNSDAVSGSYTQSVSNTWEQATITFPAKTSGALDNNNAVSLRLRFIMGSGTDNTSGTLATTWVDTIVNADRYVGQVNNADSTSNDFIITGVQLEAGTTASDFEFLPVDVNLARCQRYYYLHASGNNQNINMSAYYTSSYLVGNIDFPVEMRSAPSLVHSTGSNYYRIFRNGTTDDFNDFSEGLARPTKNSASLETSTNVSGTAGEAGITTTLNASAFIAMQSEL